MNKNTIYRFNPQLPFVKENKQGNKFINGKYVNEKRREHPAYSTILKWQLGSNPQAKEKKTDKYKPDWQENKTIFQSKEDTLMWLGHACFFIRINGVSLLTDPCLGRISGLMKRNVAIPCAISDIQNIDYILMSHGHRDHFDVSSLKKILQYNPKAHFLAPMDLGSLIRPLGTQNYQEAAWYQQYETPEEGLNITFLPAIHWNRRGLWDFNDMLWGSFMIESPSYNIYFGGDTAYGTHFQEIRKTFKDIIIDTAIMPIGAYKPAVVMQGSHVNPEEATQAFNELEAHNFVPMHFGTYDLSDEPMGEPIRTMRDLSRQGELRGNLRELAVGEAWNLERSH
ncbi:MAG: MBL fold metallo-hydrolase [Chitinophagales bacterium]